ncbi:MAG: glycosyltransferase [Ruminococcaceae bacterium]|nr:glycosyltransferase [Oscillospiraceae bacterium]
MQRIAIIPAYEPPDTFIQYAAELAETMDCLLIVNDGSDKRFDPVFTKIAHIDRVTVLSYPENHGKGYALKTAFSYCAEHFLGEDILVTADCDGQHSAADVLAVWEAARAHPDACVLGCRDFSQENVPARSRAGNTNMLRLLRIMYGICISDSQTGLRAFTVKTAQQFLNVKGDRFEYETGMLIYAKRHHIPFREVSIQTIYPQDAADHISHFKTVRDSLRVIGILLGYLSGNIISGLLATAADIGLFSLLTYVLFPQISPGYTLLATIAGRVASSVINFYLNCKYVFHSNVKKSVVRFYAVWLGQLLVSYLSLYIFGHILGGHLTLVKVIADIFFVLMTYQLQCNWVYAPKKEHIYGKYGRFVRRLFRVFSRKYRCDFAMPEEPVVFVCRHLDMHGPYTTLKWLPAELHPMIIHMYFDRKATVKHMSKYTFAARYGRKPVRFNLAAHVMSWIAPPLMRSLQAVPVYRDGLKSTTTIKEGLKHLLRSESLIVYPDIHYMDKYDKPSEIYEGFLYIGELYYKKTGKKLSFVPLRIDDKSRRITAGQAVSITNYRQQGTIAAKHLQEQINWTTIATCV